MSAESQDAFIRDALSRSTSWGPAPQVVPSSSRRAMHRQLQDLAVHVFNLERERDDLLAAFIKVLTKGERSDISTPEGRARMAEVHDVIREAVSETRQARASRDAERASAAHQIRDDFHPLHDSGDEPR